MGAESVLLPMVHGDARRHRWWRISTKEWSCHKKKGPARANEPIGGAVLPNRSSEKRGTVDHQQHDSQPTLARILVAADAGIDPHRLVALCCQRPDSEFVSVSLLVPLAGGPEARSHGGVVRAGLLRKASALLDAAGVRLEDFVLADENADSLEELLGSGEFDAVLVCAADGDGSSSVLPLVAQLGRLHGLAVVESGRNLRGHKGWLRRVVKPLMGW